MSYQQLHAGKVKLNGLAGIRHHLLNRERVKTNPDINLSRSQFNHAIDNLSPDNLIRDVNQRIKQLHLKRKPRVDAVGLEDIIVGASVDFMLQLGSDKREQYFADALHFFQARYGKENVMYCYCHLDESNPHIHIGVMPVTSDGRLSARDLFNPKTLERLQTDFHRAVAQNYGLERGEHHARNYLELNRFKAQQTKQEILQYTHDINSSLLTQDNIERINKHAHFSSSGVIFKSEDRANTELPTSDFIELRNIAQDGAKATALINLLQAQNQQLKREKSVALSDFDYLRRQFNKLCAETENYSVVPKLWREHVDSSIDFWKKTFTAYCHDVNRSIVQTFLATNGDFKKTESIMHDLIKNIDVKDIDTYISKTILAAKLQLKKNTQPIEPPPTWKIPKPSDTDYTRDNETDIVPLQLSKVPDIDWNLINWDLLSELDKDAIRNKKIAREL